MNKFQNAGVYTEVWDAEEQVSGVYFITVRSGKSMLKEKVILIK
jgi:hypothetical protein